MKAYPRASVSPIQIPNATGWELERRLALVNLSKSHHSSQTHEMVLRGLEHDGADSPYLQLLRRHGAGCIPP